MKFGEIVRGRPRIADEEPDTVTVKVPRSRIAAMRRASAERGITRSEFIRRAIDNELMTI